MGSTVDRILALKIVTYATQRKDFVVPDLALILRKAKNASLAVEHKHYPPISSLKKGKRGAFINKITDLGKNHGVIVEVCTYLHGVFPETGAVPLGKAEIDLDSIQEEEGAEGSSGAEAIYRFRALIFGKAVIVEKASNTSSIQVLPQVLKVVIRRVCNDATHPIPHLINVGSKKLDNIIKSKHGVEKVVASLAIKKTKKDSKFSKLLSDARTKIKGAEKIQVSWFSKDGSLSGKDVEAVYDEFEDEDILDSVKIVFPGGSSVVDLSRYREQEVYPLGADAKNRPYVTEVHDALRSYFAKLRDPNSSGPLDAAGDLRDGYYLAGSDDED